eukprot:TRINITY_DN7696_c0_g1_i1.p1 TRINITY_DN7696_c0_g1~~TRINITY_DN7696_c0_g1_i1.p1  ORF type:complete len:409 (+),score=74.49 TRINITY_DN7696_c0_g1_i1:59-1285(+)
MRRNIFNRVGIAHYSTRKAPCQSEKMTDIGTRPLFNEEHDTFRQMVRRFYQDEVRPRHKEFETRGWIDRSLWTQAGAVGMLGVTMPEQYGGAAADILYSSIGWEEQSYANTTGPGFALHSEIVMPYILHYGTEDQKQKYLPKLCSGEMIGAIAMTEPGAGSDLQGVRTNAVKNANGFVLNGSKTYITNGYMSDVVIVVAITDRSAKKIAHGISLFLVDATLPGFTKGTPLKKMGLKAQDTCELFFENVQLSPDALLGEENKGFYYLMQELPQERLLIGGMAIAAAEGMFEWTREWNTNRKLFGTTLSALPTTKHKMADLKTQIAVGRAFYDNCLLLHSQGNLDTATASMCKMWLTDLQCKVADECVQLHGGAGYMWEYDVCKAFVDARVQRIYGGSNEIMKELISRDI